MNAAPEIVLSKEPAASVRATTPSRSSLLTHVARAALFLWAVLIACPVRYWPIDDTIDNTWVFALNYAAAHGLAIGRDLVWTTGPLGYLVFPQDIGANLAHALVFQGVLWAVLIALFADLFYFAGVALRNLVFFTIFFSLSAPLYWFNYMGPENLILAAVLVLLVNARRRGGLERYVVALALTGIIPLIKLTGGMLALGAVFGFLLERTIRMRKLAWREIALALAVPLSVAGIAAWLLLPSVDAITKYVKASAEIANNYSIAMSAKGEPIEFGGVAETLVCMAVLLFAWAKPNRRLAWFFVALFAMPMLLSFKHGFVRQDAHVINFFCFAGLALGIVSLAMPLTGKRSMVAFLVLLNYGLISLEYMYARIGIVDAFTEASGIRGASLTLGAFGPAMTRPAPDGAGQARVEPAIRSIIGSAPVASLSLAYSRALQDGLNLQLYPVPQRYAAFTPYLDGLNATWIREKGPKFLVFDGLTIDERHPWVETPAMWLEIYRWYNTRLRGSYSLLLERRTEPRFERLKVIERSEAPMAGQLVMPASEDAVFWSMRCRPSAWGEIQKLFFRVAELRIRIESPHEKPRSFRVIAEVLSAPSMGNHLPTSLNEFASTLDATAHPRPSVSRLALEGEGLNAYRGSCEVNLLSPAGPLE